MKVILLRDVAKIGRRFEVKEVPGGHALNFLIPRKLAEAATPEALRRLSVDLKKKSIVSDRNDSRFASVLASLEEKKITMPVRANEQGHLFKGLHESDIAKHLTSEGYAIDASEVVLTHPLKDVGDHVITLTSGGISKEVTITINKA